MQLERIFSIIGIIVMFASCTSSNEDFELYEQTSMSKPELLEFSSSPYSMEIMAQAYDYVKCNSTRGAAVEMETITPTHRYVRFTPTNRYQVDALNEHFTLYNFPLDSIPHTNSNEAVDAISDDGNLYAMIEYNSILPDSIAYTEIGRYHNPYDSSVSVDNSLTEEIIKTAHAISMYGDVSMAQNITPWRPSGTIRVWDDLTNDYVALEGLQVHIAYSGISDPYPVETDEYGNFSGNIAFSDDVSYIIQWKGDEWAIKFNEMNPAMTVSYSSRMPLDLYIHKTSTATYNVATVYRAATFYWNFAFECTPPTMSEIVKITCHDYEHDDYYGVFYPSDRKADEPQIEIWCGNRFSQGIMSTTFHELAHAVHYATAGKTRFNSTDTLIQESWARYIQSILVDRLYSFLSWSTNIDYSLLLHNDILYLCDNYQCFTEYTPDDYNIQSWKYSPNYTLLNYSPLFIDITDGFNQREWYQNLNYSGLTNYPNDKIRVNGGTELIEDLVFNNTTLSGVKSDLLQYISEESYEISTDDVNDLFEIYERIVNN